MFDLNDPIFSDVEKAREHLERLRWPKGPVCPHCGEKERVHRLQGKSHRAGLIQCNACLKNFTVTVGTVFEHSKVSLDRWLLAVFLLSSSKKAVSISQLQQLIGVTYKTAWFMTQRIREAMGHRAIPRSGESKAKRSENVTAGRKVRSGIIRLPAKRKA
ncbi:transposase [Sphingopyxis granuli]|uniref:transposase n=1 Tax=Sphingopyxis granuli TaxID=267128 RepID=UPI003B84A2E6